MNSRSGGESRRYEDRQAVPSIGPLEGDEEGTPRARTGRDGTCGEAPVCGEEGDQTRFSGAPGPLLLPRRQATTDVPSFIKRFKGRNGILFIVASLYTRVTQFCVAIGVCLLTGLIGSHFATPANSPWYITLAKPALTPPAWVFAPVWTAVFIMMGVALYLVWSKGWRRKKVKVAMATFAVQLVLLVLWSQLFFGLQAPYLAFIEIMLLWVATLMTIVTFQRVSIPATLLLVPYLLWVTFVAYLTHGIYVLNP